MGLIKSPILWKYLKIKLEFIKNYLFISVKESIFTFYSSKTKNKMENLNDLLAGTGVKTSSETIGELLQKFGLNWTVSKQLLTLSDGTPTDFFGIVRDDTKKTFGVVKDSYEPFQNSELVELINEAAGTLGLSVDRGGSFNGGGKVWLQLETGLISNIGKNRDTIKKYITGINTHDATKALGWGMANTTISCRNTFEAAFREVENKVRHSKSMHSRIEAIIREIEGVQVAEKTLYETFFKFSEVAASKANIEKAVKLVLDIDLSTDKKSDLSTYSVNRLGELSTAIGSEMKQKGDTLWGLFSGVTKYTTHIMPGKKEGREMSKMLGKGYSIDNSVFEAFAEQVL